MEAGTGFVDTFFNAQVMAAYLPKIVEGLLPHRRSSRWPSS